MTEYHDPAMVEKVVRESRLEIRDQEPEHAREEGYLYEFLTEKQMAALKEFEGDGGAAVTVSADLSTSIEFGCKAGAFVSVKATCDNSMEAVQGVHGILSEWVREQVEQDYAKMDSKRADILEVLFNGGQKEQKAAPKKASGAKVASKTTLKRPNFHR